MSSRESILPASKDVKEKLLKKHPPRHKDSNPAPIPDPNTNISNFLVSKVIVKKAIRSFKKGASGGPDGLSPQHLVDMSGQDLGDVAEKFLDSIVDFINLVVLPGKVPAEIRDSFYGANLTALSKDDGGVRPIASGLTLRRISAKICMWKIKSFCEKEFSPHQTGVGTPKGCEAAVNAVRACLHDESITDQILLKIVFKNVLNTV